MIFLFYLCTFVQYLSKYILVRLAINTYYYFQHARRSDHLDPYVAFADICTLYFGIVN